MNIAHIYADIKKSGLRMTPTRKHIIELFAESHTPLTALALIEKTGAHKTTVYRELESLVRHGLVVEVDFGEGNKRYELSATGHHHHLICTHCNKITDVHLSDDFDREEKRIAKEQHFDVQKHTIEFFGLCAQCQ